MTDIAPLTGAGCNLQDFAFMPLDVARLRDSDLAANETPEACWAAVLLWAAAWHQVPAASIPNDERWIAKHAGYAQRGKIAREWPDVRPGALRGWVECSDGRLYHPVVAEKAREAWQAKLEQRWRSECARIKKHNDRHPGADVEKPTFDYWISCGCPVGQPLFVPRDIKPGHQDNTGDNDSKGKGKGQGQGQGQGQGDSYSVPNGTDAAGVAALTKAELWTAGKSLLESQGMPKAQCGSFVGKLVKDYTDAIVIDAVRAAVVARPADAAEYLKATCQHAVGQRQHPNKQEALEQRNRTVADQWAAQGAEHATV